MQIITCNPIRVYKGHDKEGNKIEIKKKYNQKYKSIILYDEYLSIDGIKYKIKKIEGDRAYKIMKSCIQTSNYKMLYESIVYARDAESPLQFEKIIDQIIATVKPMK